MTLEEQQKRLRGLVPQGTAGATELQNQGFNDVGSLINSEMINNNQDPFNLGGQDEGTLQNILKSIEGQFNQSQNKTSVLDILRQSRETSGIPDLQKNLINIQKLIGQRTIGYEQASNTLSEQLAPQPFITGQQAALERRAQTELGGLGRQEQNVISQLGLAQQNAQQQYTAGVANLEQQQAQPGKLLDYVSKVFGLQKTQAETAKLKAESLLGPKLDTSITEANGRKLLVNNQTGQTIKDLGKATTAATGVDSSLVQAVLGNPELFNQLTPSQKGSIAPALANLGFTNFGKVLSPEAQKTIANTESGLRALTTLKEEIAKPGKLALAAIPFSLGARKLDTARKEIADVVTRLRTGAALNEQEEAFYKGQMPSVLDSKETVNYKLKLFTDLFNKLSTQTTQSLQAKAKDPLGIR